MAVKDLQARQGKVNLTLEIVEKGDIREFEKFGKGGRVCNAVAKDESGAIKLTLWNEDIDKISTGDIIKIENGWVGEWQGELQLSTGKFGKLEILDRANKDTDSTSNPEDKGVSEDQPSVEEPSIEEELIDDS